MDNDDDSLEGSIQRWVMWAVKFPVITVGTVAFWRGGWVLLDLYLEPSGSKPSEIATNGLYCLLIAFALGLSMVVLDPWIVATLRDNARGGRSPLNTLLLFRIAVLGSLSILAWRGAWRLADALIASAGTSGQALFAAASYVGGFVLLASLGVASSIVAAPFALAYEHLADVAPVPQYELSRSFWRARTAHQTHHAHPTPPLEPEPEPEPELIPQLRPIPPPARTIDT